MRAPFSPRPSAQRGFSLMELMVTLIIFSLIAAAIITVLIVSTKQKTATTNEVTTTEMARTALDMLSRDMRCAGYGIDNTYTTPQPPIAYVDSMQILINADLSPYPDTSIVQRGQPLAYNPAGNPKPYPLNGTSWAPPIKYHTGAETIRWTLDLNNDGHVDATDLQQTDAADAIRTPNPNDYELCREVYGDSTGGVAGNNGGSRERIALVKVPCGSQPPLFRVYLQGSTAPWDWSAGPVPQNRLQEITRVEINVVATSATKNFLGQYTDARLTTTINELRNSPNSATTYTISGIVYNDANKNHKQDGAETGIAGAIMELGGVYSQTTGAAGAFSFTVPAGTYSLTQEPPDNYGPFNSPDSFVVTVPPTTTCNFADTLRAGGWVTCTVWNDANKNKGVDASENGIQDIPLTLAGSDAIYYSDNSGTASIFVPVGNYSISAALPDSFTFSTTNPQTGTMTNGATKTAKFGMYIYDSGTVSGTVFNDDNGNQLMDGSEKGVANVYVSCTLPDSTLLFTYTDSHGKYSLRLPTNDPPHLVSYQIDCTPPSGYTLGTTSITGVWVQTSKTLANQNFPLGQFALWQHDTDKPMSAIATCDFIEKDWTGAAIKHAHQDLDLVTGADGPSSWDLEQWFNQYDKTPLITNTSQVKRSTDYSVYALATDTLKAGDPVTGFTRPDVICGMRYRATGNWAIWYTQNGSGNEGFLPAAVSQRYLTSDNGDVSAISTVPPTVANSSPDIVVGTRSPASGQGVLEIWKAASHANPVYVRSQTITTTGGAVGSLGEVAGIVVADVDPNVAGPELVVGTLTGYYTGQIVVYKNVAGVWTYDWGTTLSTDAVTAIIAADIDNDNKVDIVVGTQTSHTAGNVIWYKNKGGNPCTWAWQQTQAASGLVACLAQADFGTDGNDDLVVGWRDSDLTFGGGLQIWYTTSKKLPTTWTDPSGGKCKNWVTDIVIGDFNYGVWPATPTSSPLPDIACTSRQDANHGHIFTMIR